LRKQIPVLILIIAAVMLNSCKVDNKDNDQAYEPTPGPTVTEGAANNDTIPSPVTDSDRTGEFEPATNNVSGWEITIENVMRDARMSNVSVVLGYTDATTNEFEAVATEGYEYFLIKMKISKKDSKENIEWDKMTLTDSEGNVYKRTDDIFISDLGMKRIPGTALNFGSNEGWIAFEVKEEAKKLTLGYDFAEADLSYTFSD
jgi:hypothetical protein